MQNGRSLGSTQVSQICDNTENWDRQIDRLLDHQQCVMQDTRAPFGGRDIRIALKGLGPKLIVAGFFLFPGFSLATEL